MKKIRKMLCLYLGQSFSVIFLLGYKNPSPLFLWRREKTPFPLFFFGAKKRGKRNIHPHQASPYMGRM